MLIYILYAIVLFGFTIYTYALVDPVITLINTPLWATFRSYMVQLGLYHRDISWAICLTLITILTLFHVYFVRNHSKVQILKLSLGIAFLLLFSYPFLSKDIFNYMFDARIITLYGQNPYMMRPMDFPNDEWLRFMHWIHRTYPYGPVFLPITLIPSFLSFGKLILNFVLFKALFASFYLLGVYALAKMRKEYAVIFATHPFILIEGLVNAHNDLIAVSLVLIALAYSQKSALSKVLIILSGGIKYITLPLILLFKNTEMRVKISLIAILVGISVLSIHVDAQPWYLLNLFIFLSLLPSFYKRIQPLLYVSLLSYYPYIAIGYWNDRTMYIKHVIILSGIVFVSLLYIKDAIQLKLASSQSEIA